MPRRSAHPAHGWGLPASWVTLIVLGLSIYPNKDVDGIEVFCGAGELTAACTRHGMNFHGIDKFTCDPVLHDVLSEVGLKHLLFMMCRCRPGALIWIGMPCSSFVFVGRSNSGRYCWLPSGDEEREYTQLHNKLATVSYYLALLAFHLGLVYVIEQPITSCFFELLEVVRILTLTGATRITLHMAAYGGSSRKTMCLWGTAPWLHALQRGLAFAPQAVAQLVTRKRSLTGHTNVIGQRKALKDSGAYTSSFGDMVASEQAGCVEPA